MTTTYRSIRMICICLTLIILMILAGRGNGASSSAPMNCGNVWQGDHYAHLCWKVTPQEDDMISAID